MDKINYSKCPLKKRPIYIINEEIEEDGPIDLSVQKWHSKLKHNIKIYNQPKIPQFAINYSTKLETIKEENYLNNYELDKLQKITPTYINNEIYDPSRNISTIIDNNENVQENFKQINYNQNYENNERNFNNNLIKNNDQYNNQQYYNNNNLPIKSFPLNKLQYNLENYEPVDLTTIHNNDNKNILSEHLLNIKNDKYSRKELRDKTNNDLYFKCNICNKCYSTNTGLIKHQQCHLNRHSIDKIDNINNVNNIKNSINSNHNNNNILNNNSQKLINIQRYQCKDCNKSYSTFSGLTKHQQFHCPNSEHNQVKKIFNCKNCDKVYVSLGALKMHIRTHTLPCKCPLCGKAFSRPWLLQGHIRTHTGEKPFSCQHCNRAFADRSNLRAHLQTHSDIKKYSCTKCTKTFSRMSLLSKHLQGGCQAGTIIGINEEYHQNDSYPLSDYHDDDIDDQCLYEKKHNQSVIVQNNFYGNDHHQQQQFNHYPNDNFQTTY